MRILIGWIVFVACAIGVASPVLADGYVETFGTYAEGAPIRGNRYDTGGNQKMTQGTLTSCEDEDANVCMTRVLSTRTGKLAADTQVSALPAYVESITFAPNDSAPTAGTIVLYDNTAESGTELIRFEVTTTYFLPFTIPIHSVAAIGIYAGFTTTADVNVWVNYRVNP